MSSTKLMSRGGPLPENWRLQLSVVEQIWTRESRGGPIHHSQLPQSALVLPDTTRQSPTGVACVHSCALAERAPVHLSAASPHPFSAGEREAGAGVGHPGSPGSPFDSVVCEDDPNVSGPTLESLRIHRIPVSGGRGSLPVLGQPLRVRFLRGTG